MGNELSQQGQTMRFGHREVKLVKKIGEGGYSFVFLVQGLDGTNYALKRCLCSDSASCELIENEIRVMKILTNLKNPHIMGYIDHIVKDNGRDNREYYILSEYCPGGSLIGEIQKYADNGQLYPENKMINVVIQIFKGLIAMHSVTPPLAHRDIKLENVLIGSRGEYKLCDFGSISDLDKVIVDPMEMQREQNIIDKRSTEMYRAPELCDLYRSKQHNWRINTQVDIWAVGNILYTLAYQCHPFEDGASMAILSGKIRFPNIKDEPKYSIYSPYVNYIISKCFTMNPQHRPNSQDMLTLLQSWSIYIQSNRKKHLNDDIARDVQTLVPGVIKDHTATQNARPGGAMRSAGGRQLASSRATPQQQSNNNNNNNNSNLRSTPQQQPRHQLQQQQQQHPAPSQPPSSSTTTATADLFDVDWGTTPDIVAISAPSGPSLLPQSSFTTTPSSSGTNISNTTATTTTNGGMTPVVTRRGAGNRNPMTPIQQQQSSILQPSFSLNNSANTNMSSQSSIQHQEQSQQYQLNNNNPRNTNTTANIDSWLADTPKNSNNPSNTSQNLFIGSNNNNDNNVPLPAGQTPPSHPLHHGNLSHSMSFQPIIPARPAALPTNRGGSAQSIDNNGSNIFDDWGNFESAFDTTTSTTTNNNNTISSSTPTPIQLSTNNSGISYHSQSLQQSPPIAAFFVASAPQNPYEQPSQYSFHSTASSTGPTTTIQQQQQPYLSTAPSSSHSLSLSSSTLVMPTTTTTTPIPPSQTTTLNNTNSIPPLQVPPMDIFNSFTSTSQSNNNTAMNTPVAYNNNNNTIQQRQQQQQQQPVVDLFSSHNTNNSIQTNKQNNQHNDLFTFDGL